MKKNLLITILLTVVFSGCSYVDFDSGLPEVRQAEEGELILKAGLISDRQYVQKNVRTIITLIARDGYEISNIHWVIEDSIYDGLIISHVFTTIRDVTIRATATLGNGSKLTNDFTVSVVRDMSPYEPIKTFVTGSYVVADGNFSGQIRWKVTMLFSKERMKNTSYGYGYWGSFNDLNPSFNMETWGPIISVSNTDANYIIKDGLPVPITGDTGKYLAAKLELLPREYQMYSGDFLDTQKMLFAYGDFTGSTFIKTSSTNFWLIRFRLNTDGTITPLGN